MAPRQAQEAGPQNRAQHALNRRGLAQVQPDQREGAAAADREGAQRRAGDPRPSARADEAHGRPAGADARGTERRAGREGRAAPRPGAEAGAGSQQVVLHRLHPVRAHAGFDRRDVHRGSSRSQLECQRGISGPRRGARALRPAHAGGSEVGEDVLPARAEGNDHARHRQRVAAGLADRGERAGVRFAPGEPRAASVRARRGELEPPGQAHSHLDRGRQEVGRDALLAAAADEPFLPYFYLGFYEVDGSRHAQSLSWRMYKLQDEFSATRSNFRITRERSIPGVLFNATMLDEVEAKKLTESKHQEYTALRPTDPGMPLANCFAQKPVQGIDPRLFDPTLILNDMERVSGVQEALSGSLSASGNPVTATEANIQQAGT